MHSSLCYQRGQWSQSETGIYTYIHTHTCAHVHTHSVQILPSFSTWRDTLFQCYAASYAWISATRQYFCSLFCRCVTSARSTLATLRLDTVAGPRRWGADWRAAIRGKNSKCLFAQLQLMDQHSTLKVPWPFSLHKELDLDWYACTTRSREQVM